MTKIQCDFCDSREPLWRYPCSPFVVTIVLSDLDGNPTDIPWGSGGDWAACVICHELIDQGAWQELAERGVRTNPMLQSLDGLISSDELVEAVKAMHKEFRLRRGQPREIVGL